MILPVLPHYFSPITKEGKEKLGMIVDLTLPSQNNPHESIVCVFERQLATIRIPDEGPPSYELTNDPLFQQGIEHTTKTIRGLIVTIDPTLDDVISVHHTTKESLQHIGKRLKCVQRSSISVTPTNLLLTRLHSAYGIILQELNAVILLAEITIHNNTISEGSMEDLMNQPYTTTKGPPTLKRSTTVTEEMPKYGTLPPTCCWCGTCI